MVVVSGIRVLSRVDKRLSIGERVNGVHCLKSKEEGHAQEGIEGRGGDLRESEGKERQGRAARCVHSESESESESASESGHTSVSLNGPVPGNRLHKKETYRFTP